MSAVCRVLVVEDDADIRSMVALTLEGEGYAVTLAKNGREGLAAVAASPPDLILLDMRMPGVDGWGFCRALREEHGSTVPVVIMTAAQDAVAWVAEVGAQGLVVKPFDLRDLLAAVARFRLP